MRHLIWLLPIVSVLTLPFMVVALFGVTTLWWQYPINFAVAIITLFVIGFLVWFAYRISARKTKGWF